jgi:hypothetical protein
MMVVENEVTSLEIVRRLLTVPAKYTALFMLLFLLLFPLMISTTLYHGSSTPAQLSIFSQLPVTLPTSHFVTASEQSPVYLAPFASSASSTTTQITPLVAPSPSLFLMVFTFPTFPTNQTDRTCLRLLSVCLTVDNGLEFTFIATGDFVSHPSGLITVDFVRHNDLTWLNASFSALALLTATSSLTRDLIHRCRGHLHESDLLKVDSLSIHGFPVFPSSSLCLFALIAVKSTVAIINRPSTLDRDLFHSVHTLALDI